MSGKPGEAGAPAEPPVDEPGAPSSGPHRGAHPGSASARPRSARTGDGDPDLPRLRPEELLAGRFSIVRFIARGGMGAVYEAEDLSLRDRGWR